MKRLAVLPAVFALYFEGLVLAGTEAQPSVGAILVFFALYAVLGAVLTAGLAVGQRLGPPAAALAAAGIAVVVVWHCRELTNRPDSILAVPALALLAAPFFYLVSRPAAAADGRIRPLAVLAATLAVFAVAWTAIYHGSGALRWQLLRHHKMLGTPAYYLFAEPIADVEEALFAKHRRDGETPPAAPDAAEATSPPGPHVVFILLDTLRADALAMGGGRRQDMPQLNAVLDRAWRFTNVQANASWTRPSMASMFTGLTPEEHGARDTREPLAAEHRTLAETLAARGYSTAALVTNVGAVGRSAGFAQGFDVFHELEGEPYARAAQVKRAVDAFLEQRTSDEKLFLYLHFLDPHEPYLAGRVPAARTKDEYLAAYRAELAYLDEHLAATLATLREALPGPKAFFLTSDHGEEFFEHEEFGHGYSLYGEVVHLPAALWFEEGFEHAGADVDLPLEGRDIFDLIQDLIQIQTAASPVGERETRPEDPVVAWSEAHRRQRRQTSIYYSSQGRLLLRPYLAEVCMRSVEEDGFKLVWSAYGDTVELYDLAADPGEQRNLAGRFPDLVELLRSRLGEGIGPWSFPAPYEPSAAESEQLRDLGYLD